MDNQDLSVIKPDLLTPAEIEAKTEATGVAKATMPARKTFVLAMMAGIYVGMGAMFMLLVKSEAAFPYVTQQLLGGLVFCLGLFLVIIAGAELFTGNVLLICAKLSKKISWSMLLKNLAMVWVGNFIGSLLFVGILFFVDYSAANGGAVGNAMIGVAVAKISQPFVPLLFKGIMCNFLVCLAVWVSYAGRTLVDKFFGILLPIGAFVACGFEHCVANMFFLPMALVTKLTGFDYTGAADIAALDIGGIFYNIFTATAGNIIGGMVLVGMVYWFAYHKKESV